MIMVGKTKLRGKGTKLIVVADDLSFPPIAIYITSASSHQITLAEEVTITKSVLS
jgi:hypothetical protein